MSCVCELCTLRKRRDMERLPVSKNPLLKQRTLPSGSNGASKRAMLPTWGKILAAKSHSMDLPSKYDDDPTSLKEDLRRMTVSNPMDLKRSKHSKDGSVKRKSLEGFTTANGTLNSHIGTISASFSDIRITHSSPTPPKSPASSPASGLSRNTSFGDISIKSAPTPPLSGLGSATSSPPSSVECSPEIRRKQWRSKIFNLKDDIEKVYSKVKHAKVKHASDSWKSKRSLSKKDTNGGDTKIIRVEFVDMQRPSRQKSLYKYKKKYPVEEEDYDVPDHNMSPALVLTSLQNCMFTAQVATYNLPAGDITLRVAGYRVEIIIDRKKSKHFDDNHRISKPFKYGEIDIPIYVDPLSLTFEYDSEFSVLHLQGTTKGFNSKNISVSNDDLRLLSKDRHMIRHKVKSRDQKHRLDVQTIPETGSINHDSGMEGQSPSAVKEFISIQTFRDRAYTK